MLFHAGTGEIPWTTATYGQCMVTFSNGRDLAQDLETWLQHQLQGKSTGCLVSGHQAGTYPSGGTRLFSMNIKKSSDLQPAHEECAKYLNDLDVLIVCHCQEYTSAVLVVRR